ncbi:MAG: uracil-DNA glycosylase [Legionellaceae bacterium]
MDMTHFLAPVHPQWQPLITKALQTLPDAYVKDLLLSEDWFPGEHAMLAAFSMPLSSVSTVLFGESPYPRRASANGYAFWDAEVQSLWSETGLSTSVNRATSLRNFIKMLLYARGDLSVDFSQSAIAALDKSHFYSTAEAFFKGLMSRGFLLLNATLVYREGEIAYHAKQWRSFILAVLDELAVHRSSVSLILLGRIALQIPGCERFRCLVAEHPYNLSFITNPEVSQFFKPLDLLVDHEK